MNGFLKNLLVTLMVVVGGTAATTAVAGVAMMLLASAGADDFTVALHAGGAVVLLAAVVGVFFSVVSVLVAAVTMPPVILVARALKLPRPVTDMIGGAGAGWLCAAIALEGFTSLARAKGGSVPDGTMTYLLSSIGILGGLLMGYWGHAVLFPASRQPTAEPALA